MSLAHGASIPRSNLCFHFDVRNVKCYSGSGTSFTDLATRNSSTAVVTSSLSMVNGSLRFVPGQTTRTAYIPFNNSSIVVPTAQTGSWMWFQKWEDQGSIDHPNFGKETSDMWNGTNGFVFGTGWGTDGPRWGIGGTAYDVYLSTSTDYVADIWQCWAVTYNGGTGNNPNGLKTYLNGVLVDSRTAVAANIGSNSNNLIIGATNVRGGNWGGYMDTIMMWMSELTPAEIQRTFNAIRWRYGL
jgi:hypothetical protein